MTSFEIALIVALVVYTVLLSYAVWRIEKLRNENEKLRTNFTTEAQAYQYGISVGITKSLSGKYFQLVTDGVTLKRIAMIMDEDKPSN